MRKSSRSFSSRSGALNAFCRLQPGVKVVLSFRWRYEVSSFANEFIHSMLTAYFAVYYTLSVRVHNRCAMFYPVFTDDSYLTGDIADDKYFRKANDSDATQFALLYPRIGAHSTLFTSLSCPLDSRLTLCVVQFGQRYG